MPKEFSRGRRVADHIQRELAVLIQQEVKDPRVGMVTINEVKVSRDLAYADVYFTSIAGELDADRNRQVQEALNKAGGFLRSQLAKSLSTRTTPRLRFHYDETVEHGVRMDKVISEARARDAQLPADEENSEDKGE
ncbi:MAG: 30S ribosome-binding factor RbfA [Pseudomonadales bacterium]|nr:30S ribosome-binding factor RbfA [Pseudomonadales bacterium]